MVEALLLAIVFLTCVAEAFVPLRRQRVRSLSLPISMLGFLVASVGPRLLLDAQPVPAASDDCVAVIWVVEVAHGLGHAVFEGQQPL